MNSTRENNGQTWKGRTATCINCETSHTFTGEQLNRDHELCLEMIPCHADDCLAMLCENCPQFFCDGCGLAHCEKHAVTSQAGDLTVKFCAPCHKIQQDAEAETTAAFAKRCAGIDLADPFDAAMVVAMAQQALDDAALIEGARLTTSEAKALFYLDSKEVN